MEIIPSVHGVVLAKKKVVEFSLNSAQPSVRPSVRGVVLANKTLLNFHEIRHRSSLPKKKKKKESCRADVRFVRIGSAKDTPNLLADISERLPFIKIFTVRFE
jgi:hypothetical protein